MVVGPTWREVGLPDSLHAGDYDIGLLYRFRRDQLYHRADSGADSGAGIDAGAAICFGRIG